MSDKSGILKPRPRKKPANICIVQPLNYVPLKGIKKESTEYIEVHEIPKHILERARQINIDLNEFLNQGKKKNQRVKRAVSSNKRKSRNRCRRSKQQRQQCKHKHSSSTDNSKGSVVVLYRVKDREVNLSNSIDIQQNKKNLDQTVQQDKSISNSFQVPISTKSTIKFQSNKKENIKNQISSKNKDHGDCFHNCITKHCSSLLHQGHSKSNDYLDELDKSKDKREQVRRKFCPPDPIAANVKTNQGSLTGRKNSIESCRRAFESLGRSSKSMAQQSNSQAKDSKQSENIEPDLCSLMQHLHTKYSTTINDNTSALHEHDSQRVFPFQATPSGNLKIIPNQVVFESKKVSVLVADPRHAKVNVKAEQSLQQRDNHVTQGGIKTIHQQQSQQQPQQQQQIPILKPIIDLPPGVTVSTIDRLQFQKKLPPHFEQFSKQPAATAAQSRPKSQAFSRVKKQITQQQMNMEVNQSSGGSSTPNSAPVLKDVPLSTLGFTADQPIDWKRIRLPEKTDLYQELSRRITTYKNADCIVRIGNDEFHCHLLVLQSYSTFFDDKNVKQIDLTGSSVTSGAFSIIYEWMISRTSESCHLLRRDNILDIFLAAQYLGIKELEEQCWAFIDNDELFTEDTAFLLYMEARKIGNTAVMELMVPRIMKFFLLLVSTKDFLELSMEELCLLLRSNYICVNSEMEVLMSAVRWLMHDWEDRKQYLLEIMKCIRFGLIAPWQLVDVKRNPENPEFLELMSYPEIQKMVDDGLAFVIIKYWYGNQTEDYYHWIDLLGLTEPTNRNWAGEDKNYVTYKEFLLYLEEYQRTKLEEFKNKKLENPYPPETPPKEEVLLQSMPPTRIRYQKLPETSTTSNSRPSKSVDTSGNNMPHAVPPCMMPPEVLSRYLSNIGRNGTKPVKEDEKHSKSGMNMNCPKRFNTGGEFPIKLVKTSQRQEREPEKIISNKKSKKEEDKTQKKLNDKISQTGSKFLYSIQSLATALNSETKKFFNFPNAEKNDSVKSEEEAATTIQAVYKGYKARRIFKEGQPASKWILQIIR